ncbi:MAG: sulfatase-like hydrolase/transferase [Colwellia sp.]|nr:sulfatase-like hydrolase/transferase [Colwellia sp.]MCW9079925.1 sulfatase-like hydrolase/transferase [Colwellia sp.]
MFNIFILIIAFVFSAVTNELQAQGSDNSQKIKRTNFIVILIDDAGYSDFGTYGSKDFKTPAIDKLAAEGVKFTEAYVTASVCSPSRAGLLTGRYQQKFGHEANLSEPAPHGSVRELSGLPLSESTIADLLQQNGYKTSAFGKWHLGSADRFHPLNRGFSEFYGFLGGGRSYFPYRSEKYAPLQQLLHNTIPIKSSGYLTDNLTEQAIDFIERNREEDFFIYLAYNAVHTPMQAPDDLLEKYNHIKKPRRRALAAMTAALDNNIARLTKRLKTLGLEQDTMVIFLNDNGGPTPYNFSLNTPLTGMKGTVKEGGVRVPFIIKWPDKIKAQQEIISPISSLDIYPTIAKAADIVIPDHKAYDGIDLVDYIAQATPKPRTLYWKRGYHSAIRQGNLKLIRYPDRLPELFNVRKDPSESENLALAQPKKVHELLKAFFDWEHQLANPLWGIDTYWKAEALRQYEQDYVMRNFN